jgi:hypothetical protein
VVRAVQRLDLRRLPARLGQADIGFHGTAEERVCVINGSSNGEVTKPGQVGRAVYVLPERFGFNLLHDARDDRACKLDADGHCDEFHHLWPVCREFRVGDVA